METLPWYGYVFLGLIGLIALAIGGVLVLAVVDAIRIAYIKHPSRFKRADRMKSFQKENLPAIAKSLQMETIEQAPRKLEEAIEATIGTLGSGGVSDLLSKSSGKGTLILCNVQKILSKSHQFQGDNSMEWTKIEEFTCLVCLGDSEINFPNFTLTPNEHSLMIKLFNRRMFGAVKYEDDPEFHRQILIGTTEPDRVRPLLAPRVREVLKQQAGLRTAVSGPNIIVYDYGNIGKGIRLLNSRKDDGDLVDCEVIAAEEWPDFYRTAVSIIDALREEHSRSTN